MNPETIREAFQLIAAADRVLSGVSSAGKQILEDLGTLTEPIDDGRGRIEGSTNGREGLPEGGSGGDRTGPSPGG
jgi:hypothetical protein